MLFQAVPACSIKVYGPCRAFKGKGGSAIHSCGGGGRHTLRVCTWKSFDGTMLLPDTLITLWLHVCVVATMSDSNHLILSVLEHPHVGEGDAWVMTLSNEMQILLQWSPLWAHCVIVSIHSLCRTNAYVKFKSLNIMSDMIRITEKKSQT